jgi:hypothetical protein
MSLDTLAAVRTALAIAAETDDDLLTALQTHADDFVSAYCGRVFTGGTFTEEHPGAGRLLFLANFPVASVTSVSVDSRRQFGVGTTWAADRYVPNAAPPRRPRVRCGSSTPPPATPSPRRSSEHMRT